ncbi:HTH araC/xylS-type domain-containing protein [Chitinophaga sp. 180180018-2]|uniref:helix-turn-helix domain-containing protein n=2 Tax=Chitinophaga TaxID=79328 RepID=UPI002DE5C7D2|nr:HTH araC/xylS-type domain-containing protein [Chitinophaga sp. 212800010-3]
MNIGQQILFLISALGGLNGILLSLYLFFRKKSRSVPMFFLAVSLLAISIRVTKSVIYYFNPHLPKIYLQIGLSACFFIGPGLYYFFRSVQQQRTNIPSSWKWTLGALLVIVLLPGLIIPYQQYPETWRRIGVYLIYFEWMACLIAAGVVLRNILSAAQPGMSKVTGRFLLLIYAGNCLVFAAYMLALFSHVRWNYIAGGVCFSLVLYLTIFFVLYGARVEHILQGEEPARPEKRKLADNDAQAWLSKLEKVIAAEQLYKDPNLKLNDLAAKINITGHQLSQLLNEYLGKSFSTFVNEYRINEACKLITTHHHLTFEAIGYEVGYNSKSTFYAAFRKIKDMTPALFKENIPKTSTI